MVNTTFTLDHNVDETVNNIRTDNLKFHVGYVGENPVRILRDTGCTNVLVDYKFVPKGAFTGDTREFVLVDGAVRQARLTMKPSKCFLGYNNVQFLGHDLGGGELKMEMDKVDRLLHAPIPITKTDVKSFIGLASYYRKFIPDFAVVIQPLTDLTKKRAPNKVTWGKVEEMAFIQLREKLCLQPVLKLPDISKIFVLRTDASDKGVREFCCKIITGYCVP